jgi:RNA polymerase sigma factor (sigma-70 family)
MSFSSSSTAGDAALVQAARRGDPAAWRGLVERHDRVIRSVCRRHRLSEADADDVTQITWMRAVEHLDRLQDPARVGSWLAAIACNECLRVLRHAARVRPSGDELLDELADEAAEPPVRVLADERRATLRSAVTALPAHQRRLLGLLYSEAEPSYADIGRVLAMPIGSIGPTRARALERLREPLAALAAG